MDGLNYFLQISWKTILFDKAWKYSDKQYFCEMMSHARRILPIAVTAILGSGVAFCAPHSKDPKDCHNPVCLDKMDFFNAAKQQYEQDKSKSKKNDSTTSTTSSSSVPAPALVAAKPVETDLEERDCPMDKAELGRNTWNLLHTMAAFYPDAPAPSHQKHAVNFIKSLSVLYPCSFCAMGLREDIREYPPR